MAGNPMRRRVSAAAISAATLLLSLTGCAAGQHAQTAHELSVVDGVNADVGSIALRNVGIGAPRSASYPLGGEADLVLAIVNNSDQGDELTAVTTTVAGGTSSTVPASANSAAASGATGSSPASFTPIPIGARQLVQVGYGEPGYATITLHDLRQALFPGMIVTVTFTFKSAGSVTVVLAVKLGENGASAPTLDIHPSGE